MARLAHAVRDNMARHIFVVGRDHFDLYEFLANQFLDDDNVNVVLDRRRGDRRQAEAATPSRSDRRQVRDRRTRTEVDEELKSRSHAIVTLQD